VPFAGTFLSLTAHVAVLGVVAVGGGPGSAGPAVGAPARVATAGARAGGERLYWVGVGREAAPDASAPRAGGRPPVAYVVPGRGGLRIVRADPRVARAAGPEGEPPASGVDARADASRDRPAVGRRRAAARARLLALPEFVPPDADATLLIAGVLSAAPDLAHRVSPPDDFARTSDDDPLAELGARAIVRSMQVLAPPAAVHLLPVALVGNPTPVYPAALVHSRVGGQVVVEFTIDSTGAVDVATLRVVRSTDALFTEAVRSVLPRLRFAPAHRGERAVGVTVRQPFLFRVGAGG
jgi:protein TonB